MFWTFKKNGTWEANSDFTGMAYGIAVCDDGSFELTSGENLLLADAQYFDSLKEAQNAADAIDRTIFPADSANIPEGWTVGGVYFHGDLEEIVGTDLVAVPESFASHQFGSTILDLFGTYGDSCSFDGYKGGIPVRVDHDGCGSAVAFIWLSDIGFGKQIRGLVVSAGDSSAVEYARLKWREKAHDL